MKLKPVLVVCALALAITAVAGGAPMATPAAPGGLHPFVYRADEPVKADHTYALMPAFAWDAVRNASSYQLQLASSSVFSDSTTLYDKNYTAPVASVQLQLPWMTGNPYALWARVRVVANGHTSKWSSPFGFNTAWQQIPKRLPSPDGLIRWSTIQGATGYEVLFLNVPGNWHTHFTTRTNVADEREYWTFHPGLAKTIQWRVRAVRVVTSPGSLPNGIQAVRHGPYSPVFTTNASAALTGNKINAVAAASDVDSTPAVVMPHQLTPGFSWTGTVDALGNGAAQLLWRVYVFSDQECVNPVMTGSLVGGPAWAPRDGDPLRMPATRKDLIDYQGNTFHGFAPQASVFTADADTPAASEEALAAAAAGAAGATPPAASPPAAGSSSSTVTPRQVSLPDNGWPQGRYWWTVVPVTIVPIVDVATGIPTPDDKLEYHDLALAQDLCAAGQVWRFGMQSAPVTTTAQTPYASGLVDSSRVVSAAKPQPSFRELPVITWEPALAAQSYDVELSRHVYPWVAVKKQSSVVTSAVLPLSKSDRGVWYYRVRGVNPNLIGPAQKLAWSAPVAIRITGDIFKILKK